MSLGVLTCWPNASADMLDDFSSLKVNPKQSEAASGPRRPDAPVAAAAAAAAPAAAGAAPSATDEPNLEDLMSDDEFAKQLQAGMADLLGGLESSVSCFQCYQCRISSGSHACAA